MPYDFYNMLAADILALLRRIACYDDEAALKQLFDEFYPRLLLFAEAFLKNRPLAEEAVEDVFIKLWENRASLTAIEHLPAYLFRATKNNLLNYQKHSRHEALLDADEVNIRLNATVKNPEEIFMSAEMLQEVNAAIAQLPPKCGLIFRLVKEDGLKYKETATLLNISVKTVENQMSHALKKVSEALAAHHRKGLHRPLKK